MPPEFFLIAVFMDLVLGDPRGVPHPVQAIGYAVSRLEGLLRPASGGAIAEKAAGAAMAAAVTVLSYLAAYAAVRLSYRYLGPIAGGAVTVYLAYTTLSAKGLAAAASSVARPLKDGDILGARQALAMIVGRDTAGLDESEVARGAVETVAENTSDGVVAPLFYLAIGGAPLAIAYKAVNTMDSMVGYKTERHLNFGWAAARLDDAANFVPARLAGLCIAASSAVLSIMFPGRFSAPGALRIFIRDRKNHPSPNSGCPESAAAGALGVRLGGESSYFGKPSVKPFIGDANNPLGPGAITDSVRLMYGATAVAAVMSAAFSYWLWR